MTDEREELGEATREIAREDLLVVEIELQRQVCGPQALDQLQSEPRFVQQIVRNVARIDRLLQRIPQRHARHRHDEPPVPRLCAL